MRIFFKNEAVNISLNGEFVKELIPFIDQEIIWGIRPEHLIPVSGGVGGSFNTTISVVESMENEIFLYLNLRGKEIVARVGSQFAFKVGEELQLKPLTEKSHFFNPETGEKNG